MKARELEKYERRTKSARARAEEWESNRKVRTRKGLFVLWL